MIRRQNSTVTVNVQLQVTTSASSRLIWEIFYSLVDRSLWQVAPDNLKRFFEFGACFWLWFKLVVSLQYCTPHVFIFSEFKGHWSFVMISGQLARSQFCALRGIARCVCWRAVLLEDKSSEQPTICFKGTIISKQNKLLFIATLMITSSVVTW